MSIRGIGFLLSRESIHWYLLVSFDIRISVSIPNQNFEWIQVFDTRVSIEIFQLIQ